MKNKERIWAGKIPAYYFTGKIMQGKTLKDLKKVTLYEFTCCEFVVK